MNSDANKLEQKLKRIVNIEHEAEALYCFTLYRTTSGSGKFLDSISHENLEYKNSLFAGFLQGKYKKASCAMALIGQAFSPIFYGLLLPKNEFFTTNPSFIKETFHISPVRTFWEFIGTGSIINSYAIATPDKEKDLRFFLSTHARIIYNYSRTLNENNLTRSIILSPEETIAAAAASKALEDEISRPSTPTPIKQKNKPDLTIRLPETYPVPTRTSTLSSFVSSASSLFSGISFEEDPRERMYREALERSKLQKIQEKKKSLAITMLPHEIEKLRQTRIKKFFATIPEQQMPAAAASAHSNPTALLEESTTTGYPIISRPTTAKIKASTTHLPHNPKPPSDEYLLPARAGSTPRYKAGDTQQH